ncbi:MAG: PAS domain S-box protein [Myxococcota bacterium]
MESWDWTLSPTLEGVLLGIDRLAFGLIVEDRDGRIRYANRRILELTGYEAKDLDGQPVALLVPEELRASLAGEQAKTRAGDVRTRLSALRRRDGRAFPVAVAPQWIERTPSGESAVVSVVVDLAEIHAARPLGTSAGSLAAELASVASRLQSLSFSASLVDRSGVPIDDPALGALSTRERQILVLLMQSARVPAIAEQLFIAQSTVRNHLKAIYRKLGVSSQRELIDRVHALAGRPTSDRPVDGAMRIASQKDGIRSTK